MNSADEADADSLEFHESTYLDFAGIYKPIISMFYGIIIRMYLIDTKHHTLPHIHAKYAEFEASIGITDGE